MNRVLSTLCSRLRKLRFFSFSTDQMARQGILFLPRIAFDTGKVSVSCYTSVERTLFFNTVLLSPGCYTSRQPYVLFSTAKRAMNVLWKSFEHSAPSVATAFHSWLIPILKHCRATASCSFRSKELTTGVFLSLSLSWQMVNEWK